MITKRGAELFGKQVPEPNPNGLWAKTKNAVGKIGPHKMLTGGFFIGDGAYRYASGDSSLGGALAGVGANFVAGHYIDKGLDHLRNKVKNPIVRGALWLPQFAVNMGGSILADTLAQTAADRIIPLHRRKLVAPATAKQYIQQQSFMNDAMYNAYQNEIGRYGDCAKVVRNSGNNINKAILDAGNNTAPVRVNKTAELHKVAGLANFIGTKFPKLTEKAVNAKKFLTSAEAIPYYVGGGIGLGIGGYFGAQAFREKQRELNEQTKFIEQYRRQQLANTPYFNSAHITTQN